MFELPGALDEETCGTVVLGVQKFVLLRIGDSSASRHLINRAKCRWRKSEPGFRRTSWPSLVQPNTELAMSPTRIFGASPVLSGAFLATTIQTDTQSAFGLNDAPASTPLWMQSSSCWR
jgi:hypothetical protein